MAEEYHDPRVEEESPNARQFAPDYPMFQELARTGATRYTPSVRNDKHGRVFIYSPDSITIPEYDEMRMDGQIRAGLMLQKLPIIQSPWSVTCEDPDIAAFVSQVLKPLWSETVRALLTGLDFGFSVFEVGWARAYSLKVSQTQSNSPGKERVYPSVVVPQKFKHLDPMTLYLLAYRWSGDFAGVKQYIAGSATVPANKCLLYANDVEFQEWYGVSRLKPCYPYWVYKKLMYEWTNVFYETYSVPMRIGRYPVGQSEDGYDSSGNPIMRPNVDKMMDVLEEMRNNHAIAIPSNRYDPNQGGDAKWMIEAFETSRTGGDHLAYIDHLNLMILKGLLTPQLALDVGGSGSYALAQTQIDFFFLTIQATMAQIEVMWNTQFIPRLIKYNFGPHAPMALLKFMPLNGELKQGLTNTLLETVGSGQPVPMRDGSAIEIDTRWLAENLGVPISTIDKETYQKQKAEEQAQQMQMMQAQGGQPGQPQQGDPSQPASNGTPSQFGGESYQYGDPSAGANPMGQDQGSNAQFGEAQFSESVLRVNLARPISKTSLVWEQIEGELVCTVRR